MNLDKRSSRKRERLHRTMSGMRYGKKKDKSRKGKRS